MMSCFVGLKSGGSKAPCCALSVLSESGGEEADDTDRVPLATAALSSEITLPLLAHGLSCKLLSLVGIICWSMAVCFAVLFGSSLRCKAFGCSLKTFPLPLKSPLTDSQLYLCFMKSALEDFIAVIICIMYGRLCLLVMNLILYSIKLTRSRL